MLKRSFYKYLSAVAGYVFVASIGAVTAQELTKSFQVATGARVEVINRYGKVVIEASEEPEVSEDSSSAGSGTVVLTAAGKSGFGPKDLNISSTSSLIVIEVKPSSTSARIDISLKIPPRMRVNVETGEGEVRVAGNVLSADVKTGTGTIAADIPTTEVRYSLRWTASRPRFLSDFELEKIKEKSAGKFEISGRHRDEETDDRKSESDPPETTPEQTEAPSPNGDGKKAEGKKEKRGKKGDKNSSVSLDFETARGIILINIPPNEVTGDLRERQLTNAAKAIIRSGDSLLMEAIRRAAPQYYSDYTRTLPPVKLEPTLTERKDTERTTAASVKVASVRVTDINNRAVADLDMKDFEVLENGVSRDVISVKPSTTPFNLVLLLDVSGSVDSYVNFIRKAARNFVNTVDRRDRISIVTFNDDVKVISKFTTDKTTLSESLDTFDAGGATAYYDALAYTLADTLRPLKGERTAIVVLTDGDDNRSFLPFDSMLSSIQESGALIYPLYVPSVLVAASESQPDASMDSLRQRYLQGQLTSKAKSEGDRLAKTSGGVYYEISQLSQIQTAYEDIVRQLRTAYDIEYRSELAGIEGRVSPRLKVRTSRPGAYVQIRSVEQFTAK